MSRAAERGARRPRTRPPPRPETSWAYFLDIDGTLIELAETPDQARPDAGMAASVGAFSRRTGGALALISGRSIADIDRLFPRGGLPVAGQHGLEWRDASGAYEASAAPPERLDAIRAALVAAAARHAGLLPEFKGLTVALHFRAAPALAAYAHRLMRALRARYAPELLLQAGKRVIELRPPGPDKGAVIRTFMERPPFAGRTPVFVGDDASDESGFAVVNELHGHSVKVGPGRTLARWRLPDAGAVAAWLAEIAPGAGA